MGNALIKLLAIVLIWIIGSAIAWDINPAHWWVIGRIVAVIFVFVILFKDID